MQEPITEAEQDRQALEQYREPDGRLNLDRLVEDFRQGMREIEREVMQTYRALYPSSKSSKSQPLPSTPVHHLESRKPEQS